MKREIYVEAGRTPKKSVKREIQGKEVGRIQKISKVGHLSWMFSGKNSCGLL